MKNILATVLGFITASLIVYLFETVLGHALFPLPEGANPMDMEWLKNNMSNIPVGAKLCVVLGHFFGIISGMFVAALISKTSVVPSYIVGILMLIATAFNIIMLPKELWFLIADASLIILGFFLGKKLAQQRIIQK